MDLKTHFLLKNTKNFWEMCDYRFGTGNIQDELEHIILSGSKESMEDY